MERKILDFMNDEDTDNIWLVICLDLLIIMGLAANYGWIH